MKLIRGLVASVLLTGLVVAAAPAQAAHRHSRSCHHRVYYSHSYRPYDYAYGYRAYEPYPYYYSYRPVRYYSRGYYVAPRRVLVPRARVHIRPYVGIRLGF